MSETSPACNKCGAPTSAGPVQYLLTEDRMASYRAFKTVCWGESRHSALFIPTQRMIQMPEPHWYLRSSRGAA